MIEAARTTFAPRNDIHPDIAIAYDNRPRWTRVLRSLQTKQRFVELCINCVMIRTDRNVI